MAWEINGTDEFADWFGELTEVQRDEIIVVVELLSEQGPQLDRPYADRIKGSRHHNMKELRPRGKAKHCRILFAFDPRRQAILLIGGDKSGEWEKWYISAIPVADELYDKYLAELTTYDLLNED